jgi:hypothetical protein
MKALRPCQSGVLAALLCLSTAAGAMSDAQWRFDVFLDDKPIGYHDFTIARTASGERLRSEARFDVRLLKIPVYRYAHQAVEHWDGSCLQRIEATTDDNGERLTVRGRTEDDGFVVTTGTGREVLAGCVMSFAYWDTRILQAERLLNPQNGEYLGVEVVEMGSEELSLGDETVAARRYRLTGDDLLIDLWYADDQQWLALQSTLPSGRTLLYRRQVSNAD